MAIPLVLLAVVSCSEGISDPTDTMKRGDGAVQLVIKLSGSLQNPSYSPDGESIVFTRFRDGYNRGPSDLFIYEIKTDNLRSLVSDGSSNVNLPGSAWSGVINSVAFSSDRGTHDEIFLISDAGTTGNERQVTSRENKQSFEPSIAPDGQWIVFESHDIDVENDGIITKYQIDRGSGYVDLTAPSDDARQPNWSPLGNKILYQKERNGKWAIWTMDVDGMNKTRITGPDESNTDAVFSFDEQWIVFSSENDNVQYSNIYEIPSHGGAPIRLTTYNGYDGAPSISPDGRSIVFESTDGDPEGSKGTAIWVKRIQ